MSTLSDSAQKIKDKNFSVETLQAGRKIGCYELIRLLGEGGMGEVWLAHDGPADRPVALKFIKPHLLSNPGMRIRFTNEARTLGKLEHDRIVTLYTVVEDGEYLAFVLRYIEGNSLADRIETQYPLPMNFVLSSARDILSALGDAHQRGIIHRDIKPQNILIDKKDRSFLTDFGIAVTDFLERATVGASAIGTPHYMSPEQITRPRDIQISRGGQRTDIYSYGIVLYEMLTGRVPFGQDSGAEEIYTIHRSQCQDQPPLLRTFNDSVTPAMEAVVLHCLEKDPDNRPSSCAELLEEIEAAARGTMSRRAATVLEAATAPAAYQQPVEGQSATPVPPQAPQQATSRKRSGFKRNLILASAVVILVAALGAVLVSIGGKHKQEHKAADVTTTQTAGSAPANSSGKSLKPKTMSTTPVPRHSAGAAPPVQTARTGGAPSTPVNVPQNPPAPANTDIPESQALAAQAEEEYNAGDYCLALSTLQQAIDLYPDPKYLRRKPTYKNGCTLQ